VHRLLAFSGRKANGSLHKHNLSDQDPWITAHHSSNASAEAAIVFDWKYLHMIGKVAFSNALAQHHQAHNYDEGVERKGLKMQGLLFSLPIT
jgi:hypothetical protein